MRLTAYLVLGLLLIVAQGDLYLLLDPLHLQHFRPMLLVPLLVYLGVTEANLSLAAAVGFLLGYILDVVGGAPIGLFTLTSVGTVALARVFGGRTIERAVSRGGVGRAIVAGLFAALTVVVGNMLLALFGRTPYVPLTRMKLAIPETIATMVFAPLVYRLVERTRAIASSFADPTRDPNATSATIERRAIDSNERGILRGSRRASTRGPR
jgi:cell shape-determining protein MreD